ncbi:MAG: TonB-dependent receptor [Pseudomonadales bacterium]|nr:TonB-dependent receptor [Pseudomonadales bacterium]
MYRAILSAVLLTASSIGWSEETDPIPEIVVTADFRTAKAIETPSSVSVLTEEVIKARQAKHLEDILNTVPNLNYAGSSNRARYFQIRGIGERGQFISPINPSVGLLIDNVDFSGAGTVATMVDVEQVEVLRGPQGTRYGANALAGLINIKTRDPKDRFDVRFNASAASYDTRTVGMMLTGPLGDTVSYRFAAQKHDSDGYIENDFLGTDDTNNRDELTLRGKFHIEPTDDWLVDVMISKVDIDNGYDAFSLDNTRHTLSDQPGHDRQDSNLLAVDSVWSLETFDVQAIASFSDSDIEYGYDEDWAYVGIHPWEYSSTDNYLRDRNTQSLEVRAISNGTNRIFNDSTDWIVGIYSLSSEEDLQRQYTYLAEDFFSSYEFQTLALFFQLDTTLTEALQLTTGLRGERRNSDYTDSNAVAFGPDENLWGGRIALKYFHSDDVMTYASLAKGYKAGGVNAEGNLDDDLRTYDTEYRWELELGVKGSFLYDTLRLRAAIFYDKRYDQQERESQVRQRPDGSSFFPEYLANAAEGTSRGLEVETIWYASNRLKVFGNLGLLDAEFEEYVNEDDVALAGEDQAHAPGYMYSIGLDYERSGWFARISADGKDDFYFSNSGLRAQSDAHVLVNGRVGYRTPQWSVSLWGRNLTDKDYFIRAFDDFGNDPRKGYVTEAYYQYGEPRIVGVSFEYQLGY